MTFKQTFSLIGPLVSSILRTRPANSMASSPLIKRTLMGLLASITTFSCGLALGAAGDAKFIDEADGSLKDTSLWNSGFYRSAIFSVQIYDPDGINSDSFTNPPSTALTATSAAIDAINPIEGFGSTHAEVSLRYDSTIVLAETGDTIELQFSDELGNAERLEIVIRFNDVDTAVELSVTSPTPYATATAQEVNSALFTVARYATKLEEQVVALENQLSTLEASKADLISSIEAEEASLAAVDTALESLNPSTPITAADLVGRNYCVSWQGRLYDSSPTSGFFGMKFEAAKWVWTFDSETEFTTKVISTFRNANDHDHYNLNISSNFGEFLAEWTPFNTNQSTEGQSFSGTYELFEGFFLSMQTPGVPYNGGVIISANGNFVAQNDVFTIDNGRPDNPWMLQVRTFGSICDPENFF